MSSLSNSALMSGLLAIVHGQSKFGDSSGSAMTVNGSESPFANLCVPNKDERSPLSSSASQNSPQPQLNTRIKLEDDEDEELDVGNHMDSFTDNQRCPGEESKDSSASPGSDGDGRLLNGEKAAFELPVPLPMPPVLNMQYICETASRLLFLSVHWLKSISALNLK